MPLYHMVQTDGEKREKREMQRSDKNALRQITLYTKHDIPKQTWVYLMRIHQKRREQQLQLQQLQRLLRFQPYPIPQKEREIEAEIIRINSNMAAVEEHWEHPHRLPPHLLQAEP